MAWCTAGSDASESPSRADGRATTSQPPASLDCDRTPSVLTSQRLETCWRKNSSSEPAARSETALAHRDAPETATMTGALPGA